MSWLRRWTACADGGSAAPGAWSAPSLSCDEWARHFLCSCKESNQKTRRHPRAGAARRYPALLGPPRGGAKLAALRHPRLFALAGPAVLGSRQGGPDSRSVDPYPHAALVESSHARLTRAARASLSFFHRAAGTPIACQRPGEVGLRWCKRHGWRAQAPRMGLRRPRKPTSAGNPECRSASREGLSPLAGNPSPLEQHRADRRVPMPATSP